MQLHAAQHGARRVGTAVKGCILSAVLAVCLASACAMTESRRVPPAGIIVAPPGGAAGYQHGLERSRFVVGDSRGDVREYGLIKVVGSEGSFAVDEANGTVIAVPNARSAAQQRGVWYTRGSQSHNDDVRAYFMAAGIPQDQIASVDATTSLYGAGGEADRSSLQPKIAGWQSILHREIRGVPVIDSVAWARMDDDRHVIAEWVYWPAIPAKAIDDAVRLRTSLASESQRAAFLSRLPADLPGGQVVIRHSSAVTSGPFEAVATYDVIERRISADASTGAAVRAASVVRHFDANGSEIRLPQERRERRDDFPGKK